MDDFRLQTRSTPAARSTAVTDGGEEAATREVGAGGQIWQCLRQGLPTAHRRGILNTTSDDAIFFFDGQYYQAGSGEAGRVATKIARGAQEPGIYWTIQHVLNYAQNSGQTANVESSAEPETASASCNALPTASAPTDSDYAGARRLGKGGPQGHKEEERRLRMLCRHVIVVPSWAGR